MRSFLEGLYQCKILPCERKRSQNAERDEIIHQIEGENSYFMNKMSLDDCRRFQEMEGLYSHLSMIEQSDSFAYGFRLAVMLMHEVYADIKE